MGYGAYPIAAQSAMLPLQGARHTRIEVMLQHDERQRLLAIAERSPGKHQLSRADVCISAHFVVILVGDAPRLPPERPLA